MIAILNECFPCDLEVIDGRFVLSYKSLKRLDAWMEDKQLCVETESDMDSDLGDIPDTNRRFRKFLELSTGYNAKQRSKNVKKEVN